MIGKSTIGCCQNCGIKQGMMQHHRPACLVPRTDWKLCLKTAWVQITKAQQHSLDLNAFATLIQNVSKALKCEIPGMDVVILMPKGSMMPSLVLKGAGSLQLVEVEKGSSRWDKMKENETVSPRYFMPYCKASAWIGTPFYLSLSWTIHTNCGRRWQCLLSIKSSGYFWAGGSKKQFYPQLCKCSTSCTTYQTLSYGTCSGFSAFTALPIACAGFLLPCSLCWGPGFVEEDQLCYQLQHKEF